MREEVVRIALLGLKQHNPLYANISIDHYLSNRWPESFIPSELVDSMVLVDHADGDAVERSGYNDDIDNSEQSSEEELEMLRGETFSTSGMTSLDSQRDYTGISLIPALSLPSDTITSQQPISNNIAHQPMIQI